MIAYGAFLIAMGTIGYLSNPGKAATALLSGGTFGALSMVLGVLLRRGVAVARWGAIGTTALADTRGVQLACDGRLALEFSPVTPEKLVAAMLISTMDVATVVMLVVLLRATR